ncbi:hypothetical protein [Sinorhizobium sp. CCBAU 05631]|uniref:hypothetical protein n=1 Tax=Sinorhizobium sp. CCBAU 05631 TaxID=794846 RepID=UPI00138A2711|nr:hypothetical protein [Sinorhizobium sp. CCBAU 05631]
MADTAELVYRDFVTDGVPSSGASKPKKAEIRKLLTGYETIINAFTSNGGLVYTLRASLDAQLNRPVATMAWVIGDPVVANNGIYQKIGVEGTGSWNRVADLPFSFIIASDAGAGTANAIVATTSIPVSSSALVWMNIFEANTASPVTVSFNGGSALTIKTNSGNDVVVGGLTAGMIVMGIVSGSTFRLVSDQASSAVLAACEAAKTAAEAAAASVNIKNVATRTALKALNTAVTTLAFLGEAGRGGLFKWTPGDFSAQITADTQEGIYAKADAVASTAGAWVRQYDGPVNVQWYGAVGDGTTDDTAAFIAAGATNHLVVIPKTVGGYRVNGTIPTNCRFVGIGDPVIHLTNDGGTERGFDLKSNASLENLTISRGVTASAASGEFNNAFVVGRYYNPTGELTRNVTVRNVNLIGIDGGVGRRSISGIYGNVCDSTFENITITGWVSYGIMVHWGGAFDEGTPDTSTVTASWHPRRLTFRNIRMHSPQPDAALGTLYLSATHDIIVDGLSADGIRTPLTIAPGDVGGSVAQGESVGRVMQNIDIRNVDIQNYETVGVLMSGASGTRSGSYWLGINYPMSIRLENVTIKRGALSASARAIDARLLANLTIDGYDIGHGSGAADTIYTPGVFIQACMRVKLRGKSKVPMAWEVVGSVDVEVDSYDVCLRTDYNTSAVGGRLTAEAGATTLGAALSVGASTVTLGSLPFDIVAGSPIAVGGGYVIAKEAAITSASAIVVPIYTSTVSAASGAAATVRKAMKRFRLRGYTEGFYYGLHIVNTNSGFSEDIDVSGHFYRNGLHDIYARGTRNLRAHECIFEECNQVNDTSGNNIRQIDTCVGTVISDCSFEDNLAGTTLCYHNVYLFGNSEGAVLKGNKFYRAVTSAINYFLPTGTQMWADLASNYFASTLAARISGTSIAKTAAIGQRVIGYGTAIPTSGTWTRGDIIFNESAAASAGLGWICVTSGAPGTWKSIGTIAA